MPKCDFNKVESTDIIDLKDLIVTKEQEVIKL